MDFNKKAALTGKLLIATPDMSDPRFDKSVVFICSHSEEGAMGIVINKEMEKTKREFILTELEKKQGTDFSHLPVFTGGPVDEARGFLLHGNDFRQTDTVPIIEGFSVTGTLEALEATVNHKGPSESIFALGYAGWTAGQLDHEIQQNAWLICDSSHELVFDTLPDDLWDRALKKIGIDPAMLSSTAGNA